MQSLSQALVGELSALFKAAAEAGQSVATYMKYQQEHQKAGVIVGGKDQIRNMQKGQRS